MTTQQATQHWFERGSSLHETPTGQETEEETQARLAFINLLEYLSEEGECPVFTLEGALSLDPPMKLNEGQQSALARWVQFLQGDKQGDKVVFSLQGAAGTGKSFTAKRLLKALGDKKWVILAPTHAARKLHGSEALTVAKALGMKPGKGKQGEMVFRNKDENGKKQKEDPLAGIPYVLLDEAGMVDTEQMNQLVTKVKQQGGKIIVMGDEYQLPPVNKEGRITSPAFDMASDGFTLTQSMRNQGAVLLYASSVRDAMKEVFERAVSVGVDINEKTPITIPVLKADGTDIIELPGRDWRNHAIGFFKTNDDPYAGRVLFFRNQGVQNFNALCQQQVYGTPVWQVGQKVIAYKPVCRLELVKVNDYHVIKTKINADNSEVLIITEAPRITTYNAEGLWDLEDELTQKLFGDIEINLVRVIGEDNQSIELRIPTDRGNSQISEITGSWKGGKKVKGLIDLFWDAYKGYGKMPDEFIGVAAGDVISAKYEGENIVFDYAQPYWASTIHKAQGSTISQNLYLEVSDILSASKRAPMLAAKLMYTAVTRAKGQVFIPRV